MNKPIVTITPHYINVIFIDTGNTVVIYSKDNEEDYQKAINLYKEENWIELRKMIHPNEELNKFTETISDNKLKFDNYGNVVYNDRPVHHIVVEKIRELQENNLPYKNFFNFLNNILECESYMVLNELYDFLYKNEMIYITDDGAFVAYRVVNQNYESKRLNPDGSRNSNRVGDIVTQDRNKVNPDRRQACSDGLHFCSYNYIPFYGYDETDRVVIVKIFPQDVVSIPYDYNYAKGRCCKYEVIGEVMNYKRDDENFKERALNEAKSFVGFEKIENTKESISDTTEEMIKEIIERQISNSPFTTTARKVSKSTKPYITCSKVLDVAKKLGYKLSLNDNEPTSNTVIKK